MYDVIIIGAGPAGLAAGIYTSRRNLRTLILSKDLGGQASTTPHIENYPGFKAVAGYELMKKFEEQVKDFGVEIIYNEVKSVEPKGKNFVVKAADKAYESKTIILAFGKTPRSLNVPGEKDFQGKGISYCATCDAPLFKGRTVAVIGGGNAALDAALLLSDIAKNVYLIHRRDQFRGFESTVKKLEAKANVEFLLSTITIEFKGEKFIKSIALQDVKTKEKKELEIEGVFIEIGSEVKTDIIKGLVKLDEHNHVVINQNCETYYPNSNKIRPGVFAAGDVTSVPFKQIVVSAGQGAIAGLQAYNYMHGIEPHVLIADWGKK